MTTNPFLTVWTSPRETVWKIIQRDPGLHVLLLVSLYGICETLNRASGKSVGDKISGPAILGIAVVLGPLGALFSLWLWSHLVRWTGAWLGGVAPREHIRTALAWGVAPFVFGLFLWIPKFVLFGSDLFTEEMPRLDAAPHLYPLLVAFAVVDLVLAVWSLVLLCNTVAEVQEFRSAWKGLGNLLLAGCVLVVPLLLIGLGIAFLVNA